MQGTTYNGKSTNPHLPAVRVRPPTTAEAGRLPDPCYDTNTTLRGDGALSTPGKVTSTATLRDIVQVIDDRILTFDPDEKDRTRAFMERGFLPPGTKRYKDKRFMFDKVFSHEARQDDVYQATSQPLLKGVLDGYNATVFAYGVGLLFSNTDQVLIHHRQRGAARPTPSAAQKQTRVSST